MEATRVAHDAAVRRDLLADVARLGHHAHVVTNKVNEHTPLVVKAGPLRVELDDDVDLEALDAALRRQEREAADEDHHTPVRTLWRQESASLATLAVPITLALALETLPPILVSMMIGNAAGAAAPQVLAGSSLSDFFQGQITTSLVNGLGAAVATLCAQSFGAGQPRQLWVYAQAGLLACLYCLPPLALLCFNSATLLTLVGQDPRLAHVAGVLIIVSFFSLPFLMVYTVARSALQAQNVAVPFVAASVLSYAVALPLGYLLGNHTSLGYVGIALANVISNVLRALSVVPILLRHELFVEAWPGWQWREAHTLVRRLWPIGGGSVLLTLFQTAGFFAIFVLCGYLPNAAVVMAANNIAAGLLSLAFLPMMGVGAAGITRVGNALGAGQAKRARVAALAVGVESLGVSLLTMVVGWCVASTYAAAFTTDEPTISLAAQLVVYLMLIVPLVGVLYALQSVFQACGAQWLCAKLNFVFLFALGVPLGLAFALPLHGGVFGLWNGNIIGIVGFLIAGAVWVGRVDWHEMAHEARQYAHLHVDREPSPEASTASSSQY